MVLFFNEAYRPGMNKSHVKELKLHTNLTQSITLKGRLKPIRMISKVAWTNPWSEGDLHEFLFSNRDLQDPSWKIPILQLGSYLSCKIYNLDFFDDIDYMRPTVLPERLRVAPMQYIQAQSISVLLRKTHWTLQHYASLRWERIPRYWWSTRKVMAS